MSGSVPARPRSLLVATVLTLVLGVAHAGTLEPRIVNGTFSAAFPTVAAILERDARADLTACSGTLIGCSTVITAAHCLCGQGGTGATCSPDVASYTIYLQHGGFRRVASAAVHPEFTFPRADVAVLRLAEPVEGIAPSPLAGGMAAPGTAASVVGFGRGGGGTQDYGLKRVGSVVLGDCTGTGLSNDVTLCFRFTGPPGANTCNGDSGGPLFVDVGGVPVLAGVTSGGTRDDCLAGDASWDTSVAAYSSWITEAAGEPLGVTACGDGPQAGAPGTTVVGMAGTLERTDGGRTHEIEVPEGTTRLRVTLNAAESVTSADFDLLVKPGGEPAVGDAACQDLAPSQYGACEIENPAPGPWFVRVVRASGTGDYQATATTFGAGDGRLVGCGDGVRERDEACDGADAAGCPLGCTATCLCATPPPCPARRIHVQRLATRHKLSVRARLLDTGGDLAGLDPRTADLVVLLDDGTTHVEVTIPGGDAGWRASRPARRVWRWRGEVNGLRAVRLRDRTARRGVWTARVRGRRIDGASALDPSRARLALTLGGRCVAE